MKVDKAKTKTTPGGPEALLAGLEEPRRSEMTRLHRFIRKVVPALKPFVMGGVLGYGAFHYKYATGREGDTFKVGLASRKQYISLYACAADERGYVAERYRKRLPKADIGKACVRFKRLDDLDLQALEELLRETAATKYGV